MPELIGMTPCGRGILFAALALAGLLCASGAWAQPGGTGGYGKIVPEGAVEYHTSFVHPHSPHPLSDGRSSSTFAGLGYDEIGNLYVAGSARGNFQPDPNSGQPYELPDKSVFVTKYAPDNSLLWARFVSVDPNYPKASSGDQYLTVEHMAAGSDGAVYVTGGFWGEVDFDPGAGTHYRRTEDTDGWPIGTSNAFLLKLDADGDFVWVRTWRANGNNSGSSIALGPEGNIHLVGATMGAFKFDLNPDGSYVVTDNHNNFNTWWMATLDNDGEYLWGNAWSVAGSFSQKQTVPYSVAVDSMGNVYACGFAASYYPGVAPPGTLRVLTEGTPQPSFPLPGPQNSIVMKYDANGVRQWVRAYGDATEWGLHDVAWSLAIDPQDDVYVTGRYTGPVDFDPPNGLIPPDSDNGFGMYVLKLNGAGETQWMRGVAWPWDSPDRPPGGYLGHLHFTTIADDTGLYVGGSFRGSVDFDPGPDTKVLNVDDGALFNLKLNFDGDFLWACQFGVKLSENLPRKAGVFGIALSAGHRVTMAGNFSKTNTIGGAMTIDLDPGPGVAEYSTSHDSGTNWFMKLNQPDLLAPLAIAEAEIPDAIVGQEASLLFTASGGSETGYAWSIVEGELPPGILLAPSEGGNGPPVLHGEPLLPHQAAALGIPAMAGEWAFTLRVEDDMGHEAEREFIWVILPPPPTITLSGALTPFVATTRAPSSEQPYTVSATLLTEGVTITPPEGFAVALGDGAFQSGSLFLEGEGGNLEDVLIRVRYNPGVAMAGDGHSGEILHESPGAEPQVMTVTGSVVNTIAFASSSGGCSMQPGSGWTAGLGGALVLLLLLGAGIATAHRREVE